jgi:hypothetical protein
MTITITIQTDNEAFEDHGVENQLTWILRDLAQKLGDGFLLNATRSSGLHVTDSNGNTVGSVRIEE